jgi:predicted nucleotidyltransferase
MMEQDIGRSPDGSGSRPAGRASEAVSPVPASIPNAEIQRRLSTIERDHNVRIVLAVESGSRAWGFPSPDSDFDVRFIYAKALDDYLSLQPGRDVIEPPADDPFDFSGWEVRKALNLLLKCNAIASEWLESPVIYRATSEFDKLRAFADRMTSVGRLRYHYFHLANSIWQERLAWRDQIALKKYFYVVRPAMVLRHMRTHGKRPPMALSEVIAQIDLAPDVAEIIDEMIAAKRVTREMGMTPRIAPLDELITDELGRAAAMLGKPKGPKPKDIAAGDVLFREIVLAQAIEARRATTPQIGVVEDESAVANGDAPEQGQPSGTSTENGDG